jgi:hypothetical protein
VPGVFAAAEKAADFEVLLEPFEQQLDLPALFVEPRDLGRRSVEIVGQQIKRLVLVGAGDGELAQDDIKERVFWRPAMRPVVAELDPAIGRDAIAGGDLDADLAAISIALASGNEEGAGGADRKPPAVIGVALVKDVGGACLPRDGTAGDNPRFHVVCREFSEEFGGCEIIEASQAVRM